VSQPEVEASSAQGTRKFLPSLAVALSMGAVFTAFLSVLLSAADIIGLSDGETNGWIMAAYGIPGVIGFFLAWRYRTPVLMTGNAFILVFIAQLGSEFSWPELVGASMLAGVAVLIMVPLGLTRLVSKVLPPPIVFGLLAGAVLPFLVHMFDALGDETLIVGGTIAVYLLAKMLWEPKIPAILPALVSSVLIALVAGKVDVATVETTPLLPALTRPEFTVAAALTVAPVMLVLITVQANIPSLVFLKDQGYEPPERLITLLSGSGTIGGSLFGAVGFSLSLPATAYSAGPDAGPMATRYWGVLMASGILITFGALAGFASLISEVLPAAVLTVIAGLALLGVVSEALKKITAGPLIWGPLFAFAITLSDLTLLGFGPFFWAIVGGIGVSLLVERPAWREYQNHQPQVRRG
jgi:benzoate membrane transport protein